MTTQQQEPKLTLGNRFKIGFVWFILGGSALALLTIFPATIVGFGDRDFRQFIYLTALLVGIGGAIYGRYPLKFN